MAIPGLYFVNVCSFQTQIFLKKLLPSAGFKLRLSEQKSTQFINHFKRQTDFKLTKCQPFNLPTFQVLKPLQKQKMLQNFLRFMLQSQKTRSQCYKTFIYEIQFCLKTETRIGNFKSNGQLNRILLHRNNILFSFLHGFRQKKKLISFIDFEEYNFPPKKSFYSIDSWSSEKRKNEQSQVTKLSLFYGTRSSHNTLVLVRSPSIRLSLLQHPGQVCEHIKPLEEQMPKANLLYSEIKCFDCILRVM